MSRHHHVNLGVAPGQLEAQGSFLVDVIGYRPVEPPEDLLALGFRPSWYEAEDGSQIHLSEDPDHHAAAFAHVAIELDEPDLAAVEKRLAAADIGFKSMDPRGSFPRVVFVQDPAGNRWELRGVS